MTENLDELPVLTAPTGMAPGADLFLALINTARPGITDSDAYLAGLRFQTELALAPGMTQDAFQDWQRMLHGNTLIVTPRVNGTGPGAHLVPNEAAEGTAAENPKATVVAYWSVNGS